MSDYDDDDDGVEPQIEDVNEYYFEDGEKEPVGFSILPLKFGENDSEADFARKNVFLRGFADKSLPVFKEVVAWKIRLDCEQPNIYVLSIERKWIKLLKPRKCYENIVRSILITVQMLHFVRRGGQRRSLNHLWDHLDEVFGKYNPKPAEDDLMKHHTLIKLFVEKDQTLMKSKIRQRLIENGFERPKKALGLEAQFNVRKRQRVRKNDDNKDDSGDDCDDDDDDDSIDDGDDSNDEDEGEDDDDDDSDDDDNSDDHGTDQICAICDDGGKLLSCEGPCKRSFHPTEKDGRESKCETLGYTSAQVKRIDTYLCANCKNKQHQCFKCGELEPSHGPNAKVFQCNQASCGYFYHPKCIAQLLDPNATDGACELERRIMAGMSFPCPIHWCFKCGHMENKTQKTLQLAVCRRCPKAYHRECLPRELSLGAEDKDGNQRAWKLKKTIIIYCLDHEIGSAIRNHIKFPATPECTKTKELDNSKGRMTGKRRKNTDQSTKPRLKGDPQIEKSTIGFAASQNGAETMKGHEKQFGISSCVASTETEKRVTCLAQKGTCLGTPYDGPSTKGMSDCAVQDTPVDKDVEFDSVACRIREDKYANGTEKTQEDYTRKETAHRKDSNENQGQNDALTPYDGPSTKGMSDCAVQDTPVDKDVELDNVIVEVKYANGTEKTQEDYTRKETAHRKDSNENQGQNDTLELDGSPLEPGNKRDKEWQENAYGLGSASGQEKVTSSRRENPQSDGGVVPGNDSKIIDYRRGGTTVNNVDDHSSEKQGDGSYSCQGEQSSSKCNDCLVAIDQDTSRDRSKETSQPVEKASDGDKTELDRNKKHNLTEDGRGAHYEDRRTERNTSADISQSDRREEPVGRNTRTRSSERSPERQRMDRGDSYPGAYNSQWQHSFNYSRSGFDDRRQWSPYQSSSPLAEFGGDCPQWYPRDSRYSTSGWQNPPQYHRIPHYGNSRMHPYPIPQCVGHAMDWQTFPAHPYDNLRYGGYDAMGTGPDRDYWAHRPYAAASVDEHSAAHYQLAGGYGEGSGYGYRNELNWRSCAPVTDKYAPHL